MKKKNSGYHVSPVRRFGARQRYLWGKLQSCLLAALASAVTFIIAAEAVPIGGPHFLEYGGGSLVIRVQDKPRLVVNNASTPESGPVNLDVKVNYDEVGGYAFLMFHGIPDGFSFPIGFRVEQSWMVSLRDVKNLRLIPPEGYVGSIELTVLLIRGRNDTVDSQKMIVSFADTTTVTGSLGNDQESAPEQQVEPDEPYLASSNGSILAIGEDGNEFVVPSTLQISQSEETSLLKRASSLIDVGDIASARLLFNHLAKQGSGRGALALAQSYDPTYFRAMKAMGGLKADAKRALVWYRIASRLGQEEADKRLSAISGN